MQKPPEGVGTGRILKNSRRTLGRLKAHPKAKALAPKLQAPHNALKKANVAVTDADDALQDAAAAVDVCDALAREALTDCQLILVAVTRRDYKSPTYLAVFPNGFDAAKKKSGAELRDELTGVVEHIETLEKTSPLQAHVKPLKACISAYTGPLAEDAKASKAATLADTNLSVARAEWLLAFDGLYGDVRSMFPGRRALAESFFPEWSRKTEKPVKLGE